MIDRSEFAKWLTSAISQRQSYHNHKETMAWVITALYIPGIIYLGYMDGRIWRGGWECAIVVLMGFIFYAVLVFVKMQFDRRWEEAAVIRILMHRLAGLNRGEELPQQDEWRIYNEKDDWPHFVQKWVDVKRKGKRNYKKFLEAFLKIFPYGLKDNKDKLDPRWRTEIPSYLLIIIATVFAICLAVWN